MPPIDALRLPIAPLVSGSTALHPVGAAPDRVVVVVLARLGRPEPSTAGATTRCAAMTRTGPGPRD